MNPTRFTRELALVKGNVFIITPYGQRPVGEGKPEHDFDLFCEEVIAPAIEKTGMTPVRGDSIYGPAAVIESVWRGIQQAELVLVDFTGRAPNVALEFALAAVIGKRMVFLTQNKDDIPTDIQGVHYIHYSPDLKGIKTLREELPRHLEGALEEPVFELTFTPYGGTQPAPGQVVTVEKNLAVIKTDEGDHVVLQVADCDWGRLIPDMTTWFKVGDRVEGAYDVDAKKYTLLAGQTNPWPTVENDFKVGTRFTGVVQNTSTTAGAFVKVTGAVKGLVPLNTAPEVAALRNGDRVDVIVTKVDVAHRKVQLRLAGSKTHPPVVQIGSPSNDGGPHQGKSLHMDGSQPGLPLPTAGQRFEDAEVVVVKPEGQGGFALVALPGYGRAMLHCSAMTAEMRNDLNTGQLERGELVPVEVLNVDPARGRVAVRDLPDLEDGENTTSQAVATQATNTLAA